MVDHDTHKYKFNVTIVNISSGKTHATSLISIIIWRKAGAPRLVWKNTACST